MLILQKERLSGEVDCHYLKGRKFRQRYFFAYNLSAADFQPYLESGWRSFGEFFFRPDCRDCMECRPIRVEAERFEPSKSQRRCLKKNSGTEIILKRPEYRKEIYRIYCEHCKKFPGGNYSGEDDFRESFFNGALASLQTEYYIDNNLAGVGFLDSGSNGLSSRYFVYDPRYQKYGLGTYSILSEIDLVKKSGLQYYYLGYYISDCSRMSYKNRYKPYQLMDWESLKWSSMSE